VTGARRRNHLASPPAGLRAEQFPTHVHPADAPLYRVHRTSLGAIWFSSNQGGRFDLDAPGGSCYVAEDPVTALQEVFGGMLMVPSYLVEERAVSTVTATMDLILADLTDNRCMRFGLTAEAFTTVDYSLTQRWAAVLCGAGFAGVRYWARHDLEHRRACVALFGAAGEADEPDETGGAGRASGFAVKRTADLVQHPQLLGRLRSRTGITVMAVPPLGRG